VKATPDDVRHAYRLLLGREPDAEGLANYLAAIEGDAMTSEEVARSLMASAEFAMRCDEPVRLRKIEIDGVGIYPWRGDQLIGDSLLADGGDYEPNVLPVFLEALRPGDHVLDVGANIGIFTLLAARKVRGGRIYAIEPLARNIQSLCAGILANGFDNIFLLPVAASDHAGAVSMHRAVNSSNGIVDVRASILSGADLVPTQRVDSLLAGIERLDVIKIDIEGYEPLAWKGIRSLVDRFRPLIFSEFSPVAIRNTLSVDPDEYLKDLFEFASGPIEVLNRNGTRTRCDDGVSVMREWRKENERMGLGGTLHLDLLITTRLE